MPEHPRSPVDPIPDAPPGDRRSARRVLLGASALLATTGIVYLGVCLADVARQQDPAAVAFTTGEDVVVDLAPDVAVKQRVEILANSCRGIDDADAADWR